MLGAFDFEDMNELQFYAGSDDPEARGFRRIIVTEPVHPYTGNWWPSGHGLGYEHSFTHQVVDLVRAIAAGERPHPSFDDALQVQRVIAAVEASAADRAVWHAVDLCTSDRLSATFASPRRSRPEAQVNRHHIDVVTSGRVLQPRK